MSLRGQRNRELDATAERLRRAIEKVEDAERRLLAAAGFRQ